MADGYEIITSREEERDSNFPAAPGKFDAHPAPTRTLSPTDCSIFHPGKLSNKTILYNLTLFYASFNPLNYIASRSRTPYSFPTRSGNSSFRYSIHPSHVRLSPGTFPGPPFRCFTLVRRPRPFLPFFEGRFFGLPQVKESPARRPINP